MPRTIDGRTRLRSVLLAGTLVSLVLVPRAMAASASSGNNPAQAAQASAAAQAPDPAEGVGSWPKVSFDTLASLEYAGLDARSGPDRGPDFKFRSDSTLAIDFSDALTLYALFQFKPRAPLSASDPNQNLYINQGPGRQEGGKMKELYFRYGDYRLGKFVQDFGRAYALLPGPQAADFIEEPEEGYEPADMIGLEKLHVYDNENGGWSQISFAAFMVDRTFLHQSFPFNEGMVHYKDGGVGNTRLPENLMVTWDVLNKPVGNWAHLNYQASVIRWGKSYGAQRGEVWTTLGADISIPVRGSVEDTLRGHYTQLRFYVEGARRDNFNGFAGRTRQYLSGSAEYMNGPWVFDLTTTQRWTIDRIDPLQKDELYTASLGYTLPTTTLATFSVSRESVAGRSGVYAGIRLTQSLTTCSKCLVKGRAF
jgi:hypothetical protein